MKSKLILCASMAVFHGTLFSILPPLYHTLAEFKAIVESPELTSSLQSGEAIISITREENAEFVVLTNKNKLLVDVVFEKTARIGPAKFHLVFHKPEPLNEQG
jgi:hypothetical protein